MNIVYLIGNGFDVAQGLRTRYPDFYESYKHSVPVNEVEHKIIEAIDEHQEDWSDMERELGRFTSQIDNAEGFIDAYESLSDKLKEYLRVQESQYTHLMCPDTRRRSQIHLKIYLLKNIGFTSISYHLFPGRRMLISYLSIIPMCLNKPSVINIVL